MNTFVRFKIKVDGSYTWGIFFKLSIGNGKPRQVRINTHQWALFCLLDSADTLYRGLLQSSIYSPIPSISTFTSALMTIYASWPATPPWTQRPPESPHLDTRFTDHSCLHGHDRVALFIHRWGVGTPHTSDPSLCISLPPKPSLTHTRFTSYHQETLERSAWACACVVECRAGLQLSGFNLGANT